MLNINPHQLHVFLEAAETLNFTRAAQRLQLSQPSVSQHIQALEDHFGVPLFVRVGRSLELTDAGSTLLPLAQEIVTMAAHIEETMASLKGDIHGHLIVACTTPTGRYILPKVLAIFHVQCPVVRATCQVVSKAEALQLLTDGKAHLALVTNPPILPELVCQQFAVERIVLIAHPDHPWTATGEINVSDLPDADFILPEDGSELFLTIQSALAANNLSIHQLRKVVSLSSPEAIALSVQENVGVGFVPQAVVNRLVSHQVKTVRINALEIELGVFVARNSRRVPSVAQKVFFSMLCDPNNTFIQPLINPRQWNEPEKS